MSTESNDGGDTIEVPSRRVLGVFQCPSCGKQTVARTRYKVGKINIEEDDIVNPAMPDGECPDCGASENWPLQADPVVADGDEIWLQAAQGDWPLRRVYEEAGGDTAPLEEFNDE